MSEIKNWEDYQKGRKEGHDSGLGLGLAIGTFVMMTFALIGRSCNDDLYKDHLHVYTQSDGKIAVTDKWDKVPYRKVTKTGLDPVTKAPTLGRFELTTLSRNIVAIAAQDPFAEVEARAFIEQRCANISYLSIRDERIAVVDDATCIAKDLQSN